MCNYTKLLLTFFALFVIKAHALDVRESDEKLFPFATAEMNMVKNPSCGRNTADITDADAIVSRNTTTPLYQGADCAIDADASAEYAEWGVEDFSAVAAWLEGQNCEAKVVYEGDASDYDFEVYISTTEVNSETMLDASSGGPRQLALNFPCGTLANDPKIRITATDNAAAAINVAKLYIGPATNVGTVAQAEVIFKTTGNASTQAIADFTGTKVTNWATPIIEKLGTFSSGTFTSSVSGQMEVTCSVRYQSITTPVFSQAQIWKNGSVVYGGAQGETTYANPKVSAKLSINIGDTIECYTVQDSAASADIDGSSIFQQFTITRFPSASEQVFKVGAPGQDWTSWSPITSLTTNATTVGEHQCQNGNLAARAHTDFSGANTQGTYTITLPSGFTIDTTKLATTSSNAYVLGNGSFLDSGVTVVPLHVAYNSPTSVVVGYEFEGTPQNITGVNTASNLPSTIASGDFFSVYFTVPVTADSPCPRAPMPLLKNAVTTASQGTPSFNFASVGESSLCTTGTCTIDRQTGDWLTSVTWIGTGTYTLAFKTGVFDTAPICVVTQNRDVAAGEFRVVSATTSGASVKSCDSGCTVAVDSGFNIMCGDTQ